MESSRSRSGSRSESGSELAAPQYIQVLVDMIRELSDKIDNLEHKMDSMWRGGTGGSIGVRGRSGLLVSPDFTPAIGFQQWIQGFEIGKEDVMVLLGTNILDGFKCCLIKHMNYDIVWEDGSIGEKPICISGIGGGRTKHIYLYDIIDCITNEAQWRIMTEDDVSILIEAIWRKMIQYYFIDEEETLGELSEEELTARDKNKKTLLDMKKKLIKRHIREIHRCIIDNFG